ncbi:MAG TPA: slipin family protein [Candidatus Aminicenantes bacterium]|nr:slipin family protein [Candidatus Aminicenantes bacterium]
MKNWMQDRKLINTVSLALLMITFAAFGLLTYLKIITGITVPLIAIAAALAIASSIRIADQWEKAVVLRMGKFRRLRGPGPFLVIPVIDRVYKYIDQRVRVTDFQAEKALTKDTVPVNVDAVVYWMVWDAEKAALEVCRYKEAVAYLAQTGLRDTIGRHELADLLQNREKIAASLQESLDEYTNPWGITCQHVGIKDIIIPVNLANAMSKRAQAERERQARVILGTAETEIAEKFAQASREYINNPVALQLRGMNMLYEGLKEKGSLVIVPSSALETMNLGAISGMTALADSRQAQAEPRVSNTLTGSDPEKKEAVEK